MCNLCFPPFHLTQLTTLSRGPTMFMTCHLEMTMSCADIQTVIQQNWLPGGCMCQQFPHTPTEAEIWQPSSIFEQCRYSIWTFLDTQVDILWGSRVSNDPIWHPTLIILTWNFPVSTDLCSNSHNFKWFYNHIPSPKETDGCQNQCCPGHGDSSALNLKWAHEVNTQNIFRMRKGKTNR